MLIIKSVEVMRMSKGRFAEDLTGREFGKLTVLGRTDDKIAPNGNRYAVWSCRCACGNELNVLGHTLRSGSKLSCGCVRRPRKVQGGKTHSVRKKPDIDKASLPRLPQGGYDISGLKFGRLTALCRTDSYVSPQGGTFTKWHCRCDCGVEVDVTTSSLLTGHTMSCGCLHSDVVATIGRDSAEDLTGQRIGRWTVLYRSSNVNNWHCRCDCGVERDVRQSVLIGGTSQSCGCFKRSDVDLVGQIIGNWTVLEKTDDRVIAGRGYPAWICQCSCGCIRTVLQAALLSGGSQSCGCAKDSVASKGEFYVKQYCDERNVRYKAQMTYPDLRGVKGGYLSYDFLIYKGDEPFGLVECQGQQHYRPVDWFGGEVQFEVQQEHDRLKREYATEHGIPLLEISYVESAAGETDVLMDAFLGICD